MTDREHISSWWADNPMTYGKKHGAAVYKIDGSDVACEVGSRHFFEIADRQLVRWNEPLHDESGYFGRIFPYAEYRGRSVLEIGCGMGGMAMLWAQRGANITAVDLNAMAVEQTKRRFDIFKLNGCVRQEDSRALSFPDAQFNYAYSWGVLHHSPDIEHSISEFFRVLKPGGGFGIMLYNRRSLLHWYHTIYLEGLLHGELRFLDHLQLSGRYGDGHREEGNPHTWPMTTREVEKIISPYSNNLEIKLLGTELDSTLKFMLSGLSFLIPKIAKKAWARRFGWSIWVSGRKSS